MIQNFSFYQDGYNYFIFEDDNEDYYVYVKTNKDNYVTSIKVLSNDQPKSGSSY